MIVFYVILSLAWVGYCCLHSLLASLWVKRMASKYLGTYQIFYRVIYSVIAFVSLLVILLYQFSAKEVACFKCSIFASILLIVTTLAGISIMAICSAKYLGFITGLKKDNKGKNKEGLYTKGLNSIVRHPLYAGTLTFIWSLFFLFPFISNLICCTAITLYVFIGITLEEKKLKMEYGELYEIYASKVPMIIPDIAKHKRKN